MRSGLDFHQSYKGHIEQYTKNPLKRRYLKPDRQFPAMPEYVPLMYHDAPPLVAIAVEDVVAHVRGPVTKARIPSVSSPCLDLFPESDPKLASSFIAHHTPGGVLECPMVDDLFQDVAKTFVAGWC